MVNQFIRLPKKGDIWVCNKETLEDLYIKRETYDNSAIDTVLYDVIGVVAERKGNKVLAVYKSNTSKKWLARWIWKLTDFTLDGTSRTGVLSIRQSSDSWAANHDYTVSYNASSADALVSQLNEYFAETEPFDAQAWYAYLSGEDVMLACDCTDYRQLSNNTAKTGFTLATATLPDVPSLADMTRKHGGKGGEGAISNWDRALAYFRSDNSSTSYNPSADVTSIKRGYPVCLPGYLGTSQYQSDHCALLRQVYGEGEQGWLRFMRSCMPVRPSGYGNMGQDFGETMTALLASKRYSSQSVTDQPLCPAADYAHSISTTTKAAGTFSMPTVDEIAGILDGLHYGTNSSRNSDPINDGLQRIGGSAISNGSSLWSCCRYISSFAWYANGGSGFSNVNLMINSLLVVPVAHLRVS